MERVSDSVPMHEVGHMHNNGHRSAGLLAERTYINVAELQECLDETPDKSWAMSVTVADVLLFKRSARTG